MAQLFFGSYLGWLPVGPRQPDHPGDAPDPHNIFMIDATHDRNWSALKDVLLHLILPAVTLGLVTAACSSA